MTDLPPKRPNDSRFEKRFLFGSDPGLREKYINFHGDLRFGMLMEEMDSAAGVIAYDHTDGFDKDLTIVTAACDRIDLLCPLQSDRDLRILGQVNFVGRSSMEVGLRMESKTPNGWELVSRAYFIMVARKDEHAFQVNPLQQETEEDHRRQEEGKARAELRKRSARAHYLRTPPSAEEGALLHELFIETRGGTSEGIPMAATQRQTTILMHPQNRNIHHKVFGGYIMRMCFETAWAIAHLFCRRRPLFIAVDHFDFFKPVEIGSIVSFNGLVTYTGHTSFLVEVTVEVMHPMTGATEVTNVSYFTFVAADEQRRPTPVPKIIPHSYEEGLKYLDGGRRYKAGKDIKARQVEVD
ncbi:hypothetical protein SCOR_33315 [Sulfidibacter corallicola]|uniref:HotDog ACOT-type domain-containing protein n=1 Tax=Sulfidibacter corallicola TaxID=2818388 RepID=A0A8A4TK55_SULCO|nr:hotdog domain-containing protein [Sulfidibacter corallicola]QTD49584.1 hypothetical protein J3U87_28690 [Sulfidibacter corallicola]